MPQVSKYLMDKETYERMFAVFWQTIGGLKGKKEAEEFFTDLLTPTEKVMLAKRLMIALFLTKGYEYREISRTLKVSFSTIALVNNWLKTEASQTFKEKLEALIRKEKRKEKLEDINDFLESLHIQRLPFSVDRSRKPYRRTP